MEKQQVKQKKESLLTRILLKPEVGILIPILIIVAAAMIIEPKVLKAWDNYLFRIVSNMAPIGFAAFAEMLIIMVGEIDLSVGTAATLAGCCAGWTCVNWGFSFWAVVLVCLGVGALIGLVNGLLSAKLGLISWITTLATQFVCNGLAQTITQGIPLPIKYENFDYSSFSSGYPIDLDLGFMRIKLSWWFFVILAAMIILSLFVNRTKFGYRLRAVGGNKEAALLAGINVSNVKLIVFILAGLITAMGGLADILQSQSANWTNGQGREFRAITCCAIGGIAMSGGAGSVYGIGLGIVMFHMVQQLLQIAGPAVGIDTNKQLILMGAILIIAVILDTIRAKIKAKMAVK